MMGWLMKQWRKFQENCFDGFRDVENSLSVALEVSLSIFVPLVFLFTPTLKKCFFAMLLPTHQNQPYQKKIWPLWGLFFLKPMIQFQISHTIFQQ